MLQNRMSCGRLQKGSMTAELRSGRRIMSDSLIAFQPAIEEPSNMMPSTSASSSIASTCIARRSEEHTSELQSLMRISYAVFCLKKKKRERSYRQPIVLINSTNGAGKMEMTHH